MTQNDIDWVFEWTQIILEQSEWCKKVGVKTVMEMTREELQKHIHEKIIPCGSSYGVIRPFEVGENNEYWANRDKELKEKYQKDIKPFDKYWVYHDR